MIGEDGQLQLADGSKIDMLTGKKVRVEQTRYTVPSMTEAQELVLNTRRKLSDLPALPENMNVIGVILSYSLFGLAEDEIAIATNLPLDQVTRIKMMPEYNEMLEAVQNQVLRSEVSNVKNFISAHAHKAAHKMLEHIDSENEMTSLMASKDILDRAGHRPADHIIEQRMKSESDLTIKFVKEDRSQPMPVIDLKPIPQGG